MPGPGRAWRTLQTTICLLLLLLLSLLSSSRAHASAASSRGAPIHQHLHQHLQHQHQLSLLAADSYTHRWQRCARQALQQHARRLLWGRQLQQLDLRLASSGSSAEAAKDIQRLQQIQAGDANLRLSYVTFGLYYLLTCGGATGSQDVAAAAAAFRSLAETNPQYAGVAQLRLQLLQEVLPRAERDGRRLDDECKWWQNSLAPDVSPAFSLVASPSPAATGSSNGSETAGAAGAAPAAPDASNATAPALAAVSGPPQQEQQQQQQPANGPVPVSRAAAAAPAGNETAPAAALPPSPSPSPAAQQSPTNVTAAEPLPVKVPDNSTSGLPPPGGVTTGAVSGGSAGGT